MKGRLALTVFKALQITVSKKLKLTYGTHEYADKIARD